MGFDARLLSGIGVMMAVVEGGSFVRAADIVGLTPSGISRAIARLEARIGAKLFHRTPRSVALTEEGRRFFDQVAPLLAGIEEAAEDAAGAGSAVRGRLKLSADPWFARVVLAPRLPELTARHPLLLTEMLTTNHREEMMAGGVDLAVRFGAPDASSLIARKLLDTRIVTCASPDYLARRGVPATPADIADHECVLFRDPQSGRPFTWEFHRAGDVVEVDVAGRFVTDDPSTALAACEAGQGLFQSLELGLRPWLESGRLVQVLPDWSDERFPLYSYYPSRRLVPLKVRAFLEFLDTICRAEAGGA
ncbi:LysR family transcriptional regulator [Bosea sp. 117]|uniref:LysR family transcriptional regulator n=1 Tax=Bosea sp. 117 TaxID=1125973 RepID=UPI00049477B5|nr:LysR family transcriptional regulator [Bosea sp. 117]